MSNKENNNNTIRKRPGTTVEDRENQLISLAVDLAEQQLREGTASSQVITHYLKLGSTKEKLEKDRLMEENKLLRAKTKALESSEEKDLDYVELLNCLKGYKGDDDYFE